MIPKDQDKYPNQENGFLLKLHPSEQKLIKTIRAIHKGEIESIKIQDGLPVNFKICLGGGKLDHHSRPM